MGKQWKQWLTFFGGGGEGSKITADGDCSHEVKRRLLLGRKVMTNPDSILKSRDITLPTKVLLVKAMVFLVVMYGCENWSIKKAECRRVDAFELGQQGDPASISQSKVSHCFHCFTIYLPGSDGTKGHDLSFLNVEF